MILESLVSKMNSIIIFPIVPVQIFVQNTFRNQSAQILPVVASPFFRKIIVNELLCDFIWQGVFINFCQPVQNFVNGFIYKL